MDSLDQPTPDLPVLSTSGSAWKIRRSLALLSRVITTGGPVLAAAGTAVAIERAHHKPPGLGPGVLWWLVVTCIASMAYRATFLLCGRIAPLAVLARLPLVFPGQTPSRVRLTLAAALGTRRAWRSDPDPATEAVRQLAAGAVRLRFLRSGLVRQVELAQILAHRLGWSEGDVHDLNWVVVVAAAAFAPPARDGGRPFLAAWDGSAPPRVEGRALLSALPPWLGPVADAPCELLERWDGAGRPRGLGGEDIHPTARVAAVAAAFVQISALTAGQRAWRAEEARRQIMKRGGTAFDPTVVAALSEIPLVRLLKLRGLGARLATVPFLRAVISSALTQPMVAASLGVGAVMTSLAPVTVIPAIESLRTADLDGAARLVTTGSVPALAGRADGDPSTTVAVTSAVGPGGQGPILVATSSTASTVITPTTVAIGSGPIEPPTSTTVTTTVLPTTTPIVTLPPTTVPPTTVPPTTVPPTTVPPTTLPLPTIAPTTTLPVPFLWAASSATSRHLP